MPGPLVSIIIPAFNSSDYLLEAIDSALQQTYSPIEVVVVDDGSTDDTREKLGSLIEEGKIHYQFQTNRGPSAARNTGIRMAKGKYLQFLDADDLILPTKIASQVQFLEASQAPAISGSDFRFFDKSDVSHVYGGDLFKGQFPFDSVERLFDFETVLHRWLFPTSLLCAVGNFDEGMTAVEDWLVLWKLAAIGTNFSYMDQALALYRRHESNATGNFERQATAHLLALDQVERYQRRHSLRLYSKGELNALRESYHYELGLHQMRASRRRSAWYHLLKALFLSPNRRQVKLLLVATTPALGANAVDWVRSADDRLWRWRAQLRKTFVG